MHDQLICTHMRFHSEDFFDLSSYSHKVLFERTERVWDALCFLKEYLDDLVKAPLIPADMPKDVYLENPDKIIIGKGTKIESGVYIKGPCWIGEGSIIRHGAYVREYVITGKSCVIGHATEVKHSILLDRAHAAHFNYVGDSILGNDTNLGAGAKCANLRFDGRTIAARWEKMKLDTGLKKLGVVMGDRSQLGCNAVTNPGTFILPDVVCAPCLNIKGTVVSSLTLRR